MDMIKAVSTSDEQLREGFQHIRNPAFKNDHKPAERDGQRPDYDDQLLQHEASVNYNEIKKYNEEWKKAEEKFGKSQPKSILEKLEKQANGKTGYGYYVMVLSRVYLLSCGFFFLYIEKRTSLTSFVLQKHS